MRKLVWLKKNTLGIYVIIYYLLFECVLRRLLSLSPSQKKDLVLDSGNFSLNKLNNCIKANCKH